MNYTILVVEDDKDIANILKLYLESSGYKVLIVHNGADAFEITCNEKIDMFIIDLMIPEIDGYDLIKQIREKNNVPIMILSAKDQDEEKILGLNIGADDYMTKPFNPLEVIARVQANIRRFYRLNSTKPHQMPSYKMLAIRDLVLDTEQLTLYKNGEEIIITPNEYRILALLMKSPGRVYTKSQICEAINGEFYENYEKVIAVHISHIREKLEEDARNPQYIKNIRGVGYKFEK